MMKSAGQWIDTGARDIVFVLNQLTKLDDGNEKIFVLRKKLDLNRVASMGHSAGGRTPLSLARWMPDSKPA
jgi:predicted dienelactone hydrolase